MPYHEYYNDIKIEDLFIDNRVKSRKEIISTNVLCKNRLEVSGGYNNLISYFNLTQPTWYDKNKEAQHKLFSDVVERFYLENDKLPTNAELIKFGISSRFIKHYGGLRKLYIDLGFPFYTTNTLSLFEQLNKDEVVEMFKSKYQTTPSLEQVNVDYRNREFVISGYSIAKYFGGFEKFIIENGYELNSYTMGKRCMANDGHLCDSASEKLIDDFLHGNNIHHEIHIKYSNILETDRCFVCDFILDDGTIVEFLGLNGIEKYDKKTVIKHELLKLNNKKFIFIYEKDLKKLPHVFKEYIKEV